MQHDFHYYCIFQLAVLAGFSRKDAAVIAYASQYVDDSTESEPVEPYPDQRFDTVRTAHYNLEAFHWNVQKKIFMPFHFLPGEVRRLDPGNFSYITKKGTGSKLAKQLISNVIQQTGNRQFQLIRLGVALHTIADTFSHFGFSGRRHEENKVGTIWFRDNRKWKKQIHSLWGYFAPNIGHAEAYHLPDYPYLHWRYENVRGEKVRRDNNKYSMMGVEHIYGILLQMRSSKHKSRLAVDHPKDYKKIQRLFEKKMSLEKRCERWKKYTGTPAFNRTKWRRAALTGDVKWDSLSRSDLGAHMKTMKGKPGFDDSNWALFHRAAHIQRNLVEGWLN
jgi:hypothetical protein